MIKRYVESPTHSERMSDLRPSLNDLRAGFQVFGGLETTQPQILTPEYFCSIEAISVIFENKSKGLFFILPRVHRARVGALVFWTSDDR